MWWSRHAGLQEGLQRLSSKRHHAKTVQEIEELKEQIRGVEQKSIWPKSYVERNIHGHPVLLGRRVDHELLTWFRDEDPSSPLRHLTLRSTMWELKKMLSLEDVRRQLWVDLAMSKLKLSSMELVEEASRTTNEVRDARRQLDAAWEAIATEAPPQQQPREARAGANSQVRDARQQLDAAREAIAMEAPPQQPREVSVAQQSPSLGPSPLPPKVEAAVKEGHPSWSLTSQRVVVRREPRAVADRLGFVNQGCTVLGTPEVLDGTAWLRVSAGALCGMQDDSGEYISVTDAWICIDGASIGLGSHSLEPAPRDAPWSYSIAQAALALEEEEAEWVVVHSAVFLRAEPSTTATALAQVVKGCVFRGACRDFSGAAWLRVRVDWVQHVDRPAMMDDVAWLLIDGSSIGLGELLVQATPQTNRLDSGCNAEGDPSARRDLTRSFSSAAGDDASDAESHCLVTPDGRGVPAEQTPHDPDGDLCSIHDRSANDGAPLAEVGPAEAAEVLSEGEEAPKPRQLDIDVAFLRSPLVTADVAPMESTWVVVHNPVFIRDGPSVRSGIVGRLSRGALVRGVVEWVDGTNWLRVQPRINGGAAAAAAPGPVAAKVEGWILIHGAPFGLGQLLEPVQRREGREHGEATGAGAAPEDEDAAPDLESTPVPRHLPSSSPGEQATGDFRVSWVNGRGYALFAARSFRAGECILRESAFFTRPKLESIAKHGRVLQGILQGRQWSAALQGITESLPAAGEHLEAKIYASPAMASAAFAYATADQDVREAISNLHCPDLRSTHPLVVVARRVAKLCSDMLPECRGLEVAELHRGILAIEMNVFTGGQIFVGASRMNHSCLPNVVSVAEKKSRSFRALRPIAEGEELLHSYLGKELLLPTEVRQHHLWRSKCFRCACERCTAETDELRVVQCKRCAEKVLNGFARDAGERDPRKNLEVLIGFLLQPNKSHLGSADLLADLGQTTQTCDSIDSRLWLPAPELFPNSKRRKPDTPCATFRGGRWRCEKCGAAPNNEEHFLETERWLSRLAERTFFSPKFTAAMGSIRSGVGQRIPLKLVKNSFLCNAFDLAAAASGVLGARHWAVQWARLLFVDLMISRLDYMSAAERLRTCKRREDDEEVLAFVLLSLLKELWDWLETLNLVHDPSCFLYSRVRAALSILEPLWQSAEKECQELLDELRTRLDSSLAQVEVLEMQPLILQCTAY